MKTVIPYPSTSLIPPDRVLKAMSSLHDRISYNGSGISDFVIPAGSKKSEDALINCFTEFSKSNGKLGFSIKLVDASNSATNGISSLEGCFFKALSTIDEPEDRCLYVPPWWVPNQDVNLSEYDQILGKDGVLSVMLAGFPWKHCKVSKINYVSRPCKYDGWSSMKSWYYCDKNTLSFTAPNYFNLSPFKEGGSLDGVAGVGLYEKLNESNYWGDRDVNMTVFRKDEPELFDDVVGMDPIYAGETK